MINVTVNTHQKSRIDDYTFLRECEPAQRECWHISTYNGSRSTLAENMTSPIKISVITAVYNRVSTIETALDSIRAQTHTRIEHIVVDAASSDGTLQMLQARRAALSVLLSEPDRGVYDALNKGLDLASGDVIGFLHSDDFFAGPSVLTNVAAAFANPEVDAVYGDLQYVSGQDINRVVRHWKAGDCSAAKLRRGWMPPHPTLFMRRSVYQRFGGFDLKFRIAADYEHILRCLGKGGIRTAYIPEVLVKMRTGGMSNGSVRQLLKKSSEDLKAMRSNDMGGFAALAWKNLSKIPQLLPNRP